MLLATQYTTATLSIHPSGLLLFYFLSSLHPPAGQKWREGEWRRRLKQNFHLLLLLIGILSFSRGSKITKKFPPPASVRMVEGGRAKEKHHCTGSISHNSPLPQWTGDGQVVLDVGHRPSSSFPFPSLTAAPVKKGARMLNGRLADESFHFRSVRLFPNLHLPAIPLFSLRRP